MKHHYSKESVLEAVSKSISYAQVLKHLGIVPAGGNYTVIKNFIQKHDIDTSHFRGQGWNLGKKHPKRPIQTYLNSDKPTSSSRLKIRLLNEGIFQPICSNCTLSEWLGSSIPLELDHIDGNSRNNDLSNLRLLCPNCHAFYSNIQKK